MDNLKCEYSQITDVGCVRELNEDSLYSSENLWIVADGMGGHACGEVASQIAIEVISENYNKGALLNEAIEKAHLTIITAGQLNSGQSGMGTTVVAATSQSEFYDIAWVGDSRVYLWDANKKTLKQITEDHSLVVRLVKSGLLSQEEAKKHPQRHMITQCLGSTELKKLQVGAIKGQWKAEQQLLLCSDGLTDDVTEEEIKEILGQEITNEQRLDRLVNVAKQAGGKDNISLILVDSPLKKNQNLWANIKTLFN